MSDSGNSTFDDQIAAYLAGKATEAEVAALEKRLLEDSEARLRFLAHSNMDAALGGVGQAAIQVPAESKTVDFRPPKRNRLVAGVAAACMALAALVFWPRGGVRAEVLASSGLAAESYRTGGSLRLREIRIVQGGVKLRLDSGVVLDLHGPAEARFPERMRAILKSGTVTVDISAASEKNFVLESPTLRIVDQGTKFGVAYRENGETDVAVLDGQVSVFRQAEKSLPLAVLRGGDAVRIDSFYVARRLAAVSLDGLSLAILEGNGKNTSVVTDVTDSINEADFRRFYSISPGAMAPGVRPYSTLGKPVWQPMPGEDFPSELVGADVVATFSSDRIDPDLSLTLTLAKPATVYLMMDARAEVPEWLARDFQKTDLKLRAGPWGERWSARVITDPDDGIGYVNYEVWKREVTGRQVELGSPFIDSSSRELAMYGIAVKPL